MPADLTAIACAGFSRFGKKGIPMKLLGTVINVAINVLIFLSTISFCLSTVEKFSDDCHRNPEDCADYQTLWSGIELFCVLVFTIDVLVRGIAGYKGGRWHEIKKDQMNWIDLFAILPFYVQLVVPNIYDLRFLRVIRLARILKLMEASGYGNVGTTIYEILHSSATALVVPLYFMCLALIVCSALMWKAEKTQSMTCVHPDGAVFENWDTSRNHPANVGCNSNGETGCSCAGELVYITRNGEEWSSEIFFSIPDCFWWCIVTFTTVGYGDVSPRTPMGQWLNVVVMMLGVFFVAMPIAIIGDAFTRAWAKVEALRREKKTMDAAAEDMQETLVRGFGEAATQVRSIGVTEHDIKRHMGRARSYLAILSENDVSTNADGVKSSTMAIELLEEAESIFVVAVQLFKARGLEQKKLLMSNTTEIKEDSGDGLGLAGTADKALVDTMSEAQEWAESHGDPALRIGAKIGGAAAGLGYGIAKKAGAAAADAAGTAANKAGDKVVKAVADDE